MFLSFVEVVSCFAQPIAKGVPKSQKGLKFEKMSENKLIVAFC
jgi:hypothetical protein